jgi:hypothetical protein
MAKRNNPTSNSGLSYLIARSGRPKIGTLQITIGIDETETRRIAEEAIADHYRQRQAVQEAVATAARKIFNRQGLEIVPARTLVEGIRAHVEGGKANKHRVQDALVAAGFRRAPNNRGMMLPEGDPVGQDIAEFYEDVPAPPSRAAVKRSTATKPAAKKSTAKKSARK